MCIFMMSYMFSVCRCASDTAEFLPEGRGISVESVIEGVSCYGSGHSLAMHTGYIHVPRLYTLKTG